jgi:hypothetical protein
MIKTNFKFESTLEQTPAYGGQYAVYISKGHKDGSTLLAGLFTCRYHAEDFIINNNPNSFAWNGREHSDQR